MLSVNKISLSFPLQTSLFFSELSLNIDTGKFYSIIGPNGCGKSTLFNCITNKYRTKSGSISYQNKNILNFASKELAQNISYLAQQLPESIPFTTKEIVLMGRYPYKKLWESYSNEDEEIAEKYIRYLDLVDQSNMSYTNLSGGEQRRVFLAQALTTETQLLLLDEPDAFLDPEHKKELYELLKLIQLSLNKTIIIISHDIQLSLLYSDFIIGMKKGAIEFQVKTELLTTDMLRKLFNTDLSLHAINNSIVFSYK